MSSSKHNSFIFIYFFVLQLHFPSRVFVIQRRLIQLECVTHRENAVSTLVPAGHLENPFAF